MRLLTALFKSSIVALCLVSNGFASAPLSDVSNRLPTPGFKRLDPTVAVVVDYGSFDSPVAANVVLPVQGAQSLDLNMYGSPDGVIVGGSLQSTISNRHFSGGDLPEEYKDVRVFKQAGIRPIILDTEWDEDRNLREVSAIEFINGKRGKILFKKYDANSPAHLDIKTVFEFIEDKSNANNVTIIIAHNAAADYSILFHELSKHYAVGNIHSDAKILEHKIYKTFWFDSYRFLQRKYRIAEGKAEQQVEIRDIEFSFPTASMKKQKALLDKKKRKEAKKKSEEKKRVRECELIEAGKLNSDGSLPEEDENSPVQPKPSFKLADAFGRTGVTMEKIQKRLRIGSDVPIEQGVQSDDFKPHNAFYDILMTFGVIDAECRQQEIDNPRSFVRSLFNN